MESRAHPIAGFIRERALELGFDRVGFAPAHPPARAAFLAKWLAEGRHGQMAWIARTVEARQDPRKYFPEARTVVCLTANYYSPEAAAMEPDRGRISRYAWGDDYHEIVKTNLHRLADRVRAKFPDVPCRVAVDTAPVLEKPFAQAAGLGWLGKNGCFLVPGAGSWFFLGEMLVGASLPALPEGRDHCGTCSACIDVCPTGAIVAPYVVDAQRCISYLTIEHRGPIARELRPLMGNRIFGCDDCQDICPWNRFATRSPHPGFSPRPENLAPLLAELLGLSEVDFRRRFRRSPVLRPKREGFLRNVAIAAGNSGDGRLVEPLARALADEAAVVRGHAAWALGRLAGSRAREALVERASRESDPWVSEEIELALREIERAAGTPPRTVSGGASAG